MKNNGVPGNDLITTYWIKKLTSTHNPNSMSEHHLQTIHQNDKLIYNRSLYNQQYHHAQTSRRKARELGMYRPIPHDVVQLQKSFQFCSTWLDTEGTRASSSTIENNQHNQIANEYMHHKALS